MKAATLLVLAVLCLTGCDETQSPRPTATAPPGSTAPFSVVIAADQDDPRLKGFVVAARLAAKVEPIEASSPPIRVRTVELSGTSLAGLTDEPNVAGVLTIGGREAIEAAGGALNESGLAVFELTDDLYGADGLRRSVFQAATPHSWQAFRLARYFGRGDRGYRKVGLVSQPGSSRDIAAAGLIEDLRLRGVEFVEASDVAAIAESRPAAVIIDGSDSFVADQTKALHASHPYTGRAGTQATQDWGPQIAGFESMLRIGDLPPHVVAAGTYARPFVDQPVDAASRFRNAYRKHTKQSPRGDEVLAFDAVHVIKSAAMQGGSRQQILDRLETVDRRTFGHLPISLGPDDHLLAERDVLGLWVNEPAEGWRHLMRTFTSDLERTNILEEDWPAFFDGTTPGGEAPFYHSAKVGITTAPTDDLR